MSETPFFVHRAECCSFFFFGKQNTVVPFYGRDFFLNLEKTCAPVSVVEIRVLFFHIEYYPVWCLASFHFQFRLVINRIRKSKEKNRKSSLSSVRETNNISKTWITLYEKKKKRADDAEKTRVIRLEKISNNFVIFVGEPVSLKL